MSPEIAMAPPWCSVFGEEHFKRYLALVAFDEAHCVIEWYVVVLYNAKCNHNVCICTGVRNSGQHSARLVG